MVFPIESSGVFLETCSRMIANSIVMLWREEAEQLWIQLDVSNSVMLIL